MAIPPIAHYQIGDAVMNSIMELDIVVYTKPICESVSATCKELYKAGLNYRSVDVSVDVEARDHMMSLGYFQAPVVICQWKIGGTVVSEPDIWSGFRPDLIRLQKSHYDYVVGKVTTAIEERFGNLLTKLLLA